MNKDNIDRIIKMEKYYDLLLKTIKECPKKIIEDKFIIKIKNELISYYESKQWLIDYELDEKDLLPNELKRGVLSQDGIYNLLIDINEIEKYYKE